MRNKDIRFARNSTNVIGLNLIRGNVSSSSTGARVQKRAANANRRSARNGNTRRVAKAA